MLGEISSKDTPDESVKYLRKDEIDMEAGVLSLLSVDVAGITTSQEPKLYCCPYSKAPTQIEHGRSPPLHT